MIRLLEYGVPGLILLPSASTGFSSSLSLDQASALVSIIPDETVEDVAEFLSVSVERDQLIDEE